MIMKTINTSKIQICHDVIFDIDGNSVPHVKENGLFLKFDDWVKKKSAEEARRILRGREWRRRR